MRSFISLSRMPIPVAPLFASTTILPPARPLSGSTRISPRLSRNEPVVVCGKPLRVKLIVVLAGSRSIIASCLTGAAAAPRLATIRRATAASSRRIGLQTGHAGGGTHDQGSGGQTGEIADHDRRIYRADMGRQQ